MGCTTSNLDKVQRDKYIEQALGSIPVGMKQRYSKRQLKKKLGDYWDGCDKNNRYVPSITWERAKNVILTPRARYLR
jgi:hypothetical protein